MKDLGDNRYKIVYFFSADKTLAWDGENFHDAELDFYIWYNDEFEQYQYWYEPISGDYGDYGWMEYDTRNKHWYIEEEKGHWIMVPEKYDTSKLYYIVD